MTYFAPNFAPPTGQTPALETMAGGGPRDKLVQLERIERDIASSLQSAGQALQELSKDKPSLKQAESHTTSFLKTLQEVENGMQLQINYLTQVSTGQPHEGSCYSAQKDLQMAYHRMEHVKSRLGELEKIRMEHLRQRQGQMVRSYSLPEHLPPPPLQHQQLPHPMPHPQHQFH
ncbi:mediator of RNA polymerase II transcription subunit 11-like [Haliotis rufescens]|uniref:mediator of RNA polymerase II transcription subunit 11-like n=1 Tax=Haliotis rufescens TaxID=6454 RepID=UPI001EAF9D72|nr:mediator of RNA polymerase II transcription subunit 11-like [Haliotis rufescens]